MIRKIILVFLLFFSFACNPSPVENIYRKEGRFLASLNVPVGYLVTEWGGKIRVSASGWLISGGSGTLFTAKHFTDTFINNVVELGVNECKFFLSNGRVFTCILVQVPPKRDAVVLKIVEPFKASELPTPYKISATRLGIGDKVFIQGFHPHSSEIMALNRKEGFADLAVPILRDFYEIRTADPSRRSEVVFDNLEGRRIGPDPDSVTNNPILSDEEKMGMLEYENDSYIKVRMARDHKFSFGGLSGGVALNAAGEVVGLITAQDIFRFQFDDKGFFVDPSSGNVTARVKKQLFDTIYITPIESIKDLYEYARRAR